MAFKVMAVTTIIFFMIIAFATPAPPRELPRRLYIGPYESDVTLGGSTGFKAMIDRVRPFGMNAVALGTRADAGELFAVAEQEAFYLIFKTTYDLDRSWWDDAVSNTGQAAATAAEAITAVAMPYLIAYDLRDEPSLDDEQKLCAIIDAVRARDPGAAATTVLIGRGRGDLLFDRCQPDTLYLDVYPFIEESEIGDFSMRAFGYDDLDFVEYIRYFTRRAQADTPLWIILQTHGTSWPTYDLRAPTPSELRAMQWMALGEGATGIFYFHWGSMQTWIGLRDNPELFKEAASFAQTVRPFEKLIVAWRKQRDWFSVLGGAYVSTLKDTRDSTQYALVVNREVTGPKQVQLQAPLSGVFTDLETGERYTSGASLVLAPGEGRIFRFSLSVPK